MNGAPSEFFCLRVGSAGRSTTIATAIFGRDDISISPMTFLIQVESNAEILRCAQDDDVSYPSNLGGQLELVEGGAGALEVGEFHPRIFAGEDDAVGIALGRRRGWHREGEDKSHVSEARHGAPR